VNVPSLERPETLKAAALVALLAASFVVAFASARDPRSWLNRSLSRYVESLRSQLASMFVFVDVWPIVVGQLVAIYVVLAATVLGADRRLWAAVVVVVVLPVLLIGRMRRKRLAQIELQADSFVTALASAMRSTPSIADAFISTSRVVSDPLRSEIELAVKHMRVGATLEEALLLMGQRIGSRAFDTALTTVLIGQRLGGDVPTTLARTGTAIRELNRLDRTARSTLASAKAQMKLIAAVPLLFPFVVNQVSPGYFEPLRTHAFGWVAVAVAAVLWVGAILLGRRILAVMP
jgi:tight adherence protein B